MPSVNPAHVAEISHLKTTITKLAAQLTHYQHLEPPLEPANPDAPHKLLSGHMLAPLFKEYEATITS